MLFRSGRLLVGHLTGGRELRLVTPGDRGLPPLLFPTASSPTGGKVSPDERWVAYTSAASGQVEVYVNSLPTAGLPLAVSTGGISPSSRGYTWAKSGSLLFFRRRTGEVVSIEIGPNGPRPETLREVGLRDFQDFDTFPDGRFLAVKRESNRQRTRPLVVVVNWAATVIKKQ